MPDDANQSAAFPAAEYLAEVQAGTNRLRMRKTLVAGQFHFIMKSYILINTLTGKTVKASVELTYDEFIVLNYAYALNHSTLRYIDR